LGENLLQQQWISIADVGKPKLRQVWQCSMKRASKQQIYTTLAPDFYEHHRVRYRTASDLQPSLLSPAGWRNGLLADIVINDHVWYADRGSITGKIRAEDDYPR
jgi:hypothetical protein